MLITDVNVFSVLKGFGIYDPRPSIPLVVLVSQLKLNGAMINFPYFRIVRKPNIPYGQVPMLGEITCGVKSLLEYTFYKVYSIFYIIMI